MTDQHYTKSFPRKHREIYFMREYVKLTDGTWKFSYETQAGVNLAVDSSFDGWQNPRWRQQVRQHTCATTPATGIKRSVSAQWAGPVTFIGSNFKRVVVGDLYGGTYAPTPIGAPSSGSLLDNQALSRFYRKAYDIVAPVQGGVILAELHKTLSDLRNPLKGLTEALTAYTNRVLLRKNGAKLNKYAARQSFLKGVQDQWLQTVYGLKPTLSDISSIVGYLQTYAPALCAQSYHILGTSKVESVFLDQNQVLYELNGVPQFYGRVIGTSEQSVRYKGEIVVSAVGPHRVVKSLGLDPLYSFVPTIYELIPYSFLVDYFSNLGDVVKSYSVPSSSVLWYNRTRRGLSVITEAATRWKIPNPGNPVWNSGALPSVRRSRFMTFSRDGGGHQSLPVPRLQLDAHFGVLRAINVLFLATQKLRPSHIPVVKFPP